MVGDIVTALIIFYWVIPLALGGLVWILVHLAFGILSAYSR
jgi:hypothetical protein